jgi:pachytene checkpoint protein 2
MSSAYLYTWLHGFTLKVLGSQKQGMSGRGLRRLPVLALARYIGIGFTVSSSISAPSVPSLPASGLNSRKGSINGDMRKGVSSSKDGNAKRKALRVEGGGADVEIWLDGMEKVIIESGEEVKRFE